MATSLRDKLKAVDKEKAPSPPAHRQQGMFVSECRYPLSDFPHVFDVTSITLSQMDTGDFISPLDPYRVLYIDTETTGLSTGAGTVAFLVGLGYLQGDCFVVKQFLMRDYCDESPMLIEIESIMKDFDMLVTFNGKTFDLPLLRTRFLMNRIPQAVLEMPHADLLHIARRIFKMRLSKCNLSHLEEAVFLKPRSDDDLPGALIPQRYFDYLKTGQFSLLTDVLEHNKQDIASLCQLLAHMAYMYDHPDTIVHQQDVFSIGVALEKRHMVEKARHCYYLSLSGATSAMSHHRLAISYRRTNELDDACRMFEKMIARKEGGIMPHIELAKLYEHRLHDIDKALYHVRNAIILYAEPTLFADAAVQDTQNALQYRYDRLMRKKEKQKGDMVK